MPEHQKAQKKSQKIQSTQVKRKIAEGQYRSRRGGANQTKEGASPFLIE